MDIFNFETVALKNDAMIILDQTRLPGEVKYLALTGQEEIWDAIYRLKVRGAPAIGAAAAIGIYLGALEISCTDYDGFYEQFKKKKDYLASARPTAVNLFWALNRMEDCVAENSGRTADEIKRALLKRVLAILDEDVRVCRQIGRFGAGVLQDGIGILTHCNAGTLATVKYGTALSPVYVAMEELDYKNLKVYCDETRPLLQGARLTAFELTSAGADTTLLCDSAASLLMRQGKVQMIFVGCDRVAANGDVVNKVGTSSVAINAKRYGIPFYVCCPTSTLDMNTKTGDDIHIEMRPDEEVTSMWYETPMAPDGVKVYNPAFDITDHDYVTGIITEFGIARAPYDVSLKKIMNQKAAGK